MRTLGMVTAIVIAAVALVVGVVAARSIPDIKRYLKIREM
ncbi:MAG: hypothetical protein JWO11_1788 [Nocardioides sp.]|nr:hypothetical protein [Nocardioides sp.]